MNLTWNEIKNLKGKKLKEKSTGQIYEVNYEMIYLETIKEMY